jgi:hypothetical protein
MSAKSLEYLSRFALITAAIAASACHDERAGQSSAQAAAPSAYSVGATVSGLNGTGLVLQNNAGGDIGVTVNGSVTFSSRQLAGSAYAVTVRTQPSTPDQTCAVANGAGTVAHANVSNVTVTCKDNYVPTYTPAAKGNPSGTATTQQVDGMGGSVTSADGRLTLDIPAGALASATQISVQPITSTTPNGIGLAYRLEPEGTAFAAPVTLTFHLSTAEALGIASTYVVTQHPDGLWYSLRNQQRDADAQTVSMSATHFSDWSLAETLVLKPPKQRVKTREAASFTPEILMVNEEGDELANPFGDDVALPMPTTLSNQLNGTKVASVNGIEGGNATIGLIRFYGSTSSTLSYTAPPTPPTPSTVTVSLTVELGKSKVIAPAEVEIYAQEIWTGTTDITQIDGTQIHADVTFAEKISASSATKIDFLVQSGQVRVKIPPTNGSGCTQTISPDTHTIAQDEGSMSLLYTTASGPEDASVTAGGTTVWPATLTTVCPNGTQMIDTAVQAPWWPALPASSSSLQALNGVIDGTVGNQLATGTVRFVRQ